MDIKPILFNTDMVRAILEGRKTVTRLVVKPQPEGAHDIFGPSEENDRIFEFFCGGFDGKKFADWVTAVKMPYRPCDILYVRETWRIVDYLYGSSLKFEYAADGKISDFIDFANDRLKKFLKYIGSKKWCPSLFMPKEAARIFLRVTDVRVERLQDITDSDCGKEGIAVWTKDGGRLYKYAPADEDGDYPVWKWSDAPKTPQEAMQRVWDSTFKTKDHAIYGWAVNPWVWVISFERIRREEALSEKSWDFRGCPRLCLR